MSEFETDAKKYQVIPFFFVETVHMDFLSKQAGRPIHEDREMVRIMIPGARGTVVSERVSDEHMARWPEQYKAFKAGREPPIEGTALRDWPNSQLTGARVADLAYFNITTVEHLAAVTDANLANLGMGARELREVAKKFLEVSRTGTGPLERLVNENLNLKDDVQRLTRELTEANARAQQKEPADASAAA